MTEQYREAGDEELPTVLHFLTRAAATLAIAIGALCICGWALNLERLRALPGFVSMNPVTACNFIILGIALVLCAESRIGTSASVAAKWLAGLVLLIAAVKLIGIVADFHPNIDEWLFPGSLTAPGSRPNRMAPNTAFDFLLLGFAILLLDLRWGGTSVGQVLAIVAVFCALLPLTGYLYGARSLQGVGAFIPMSPQTAVTFLFVAAGLFFSRSRLPLTQVFATRDPRGVLARRLAPFAVCLTLALGWLRLAGEQRGLYDAPVGTAMLAVTLSLFFVLLVAWAASTVGRAERDRYAANLALLEKRVELEESLRETQLIIDHAHEIICTVNNRGKILTMNFAAEHMLGIRPAAILGHAFTELHSADERPKVEAVLKAAQCGLSGGETTTQCPRTHGSVARVAWSVQYSAHYKRTFCVGREVGPSSDQSAWAQSV